MLRILALILTMWPVAASADPVSMVAWAISAIGAGIGGVVGAGLIMYAVPIAFGIVVASAISLADRAKKKARDAANATLRDRVVTVRGSAEYRRVVLGRQPVGGVVAFYGSVGQYKEQFVMVIALATHEIDAVEEIWLNDTKLILGGVNNEWAQPNPDPTATQYALNSALSYAESLTGDGTTTVFSTTYPAMAGSLTAVVGNGVDSEVLSATPSGSTIVFAVAPSNGANVSISYQYSTINSYVRVRSFLGAPGQTVDSVVSSLFPTDWDSTHPMSGCAGIAIHFYYSEDIFVSGLPNVMAVCRGAKVYDPRKDSTNGGSGVHRENNPATWEWSESPPLLIGYYALSPFGGQLPAGSINWPYAATSAEVCDTLVDYSNWAHLVNENGLLITTEGGDVILAGATGAETDPLYVAGIVARCDQRPLDIINELAEAMAGKVAFIGNQLIIKAGQYTAPVLSLGDKDFAGPGVVVQAKVPRENLFNEVSAKVLDRAQDWKEVSMPRVTSAAYVAQDGKKLVMSGVEYGAIHRVEQAQQVSAVMLRASRQALTFTARFKLAALPLQLLDTFSLTNARRGWSNKPFEVIGRKWSIDGLIEITGRETDPSIYAFGDVFDAVDAAPNTNLPQITNVSQPLGVAVESGTSELTDGSIITRVKVSWLPTQDQTVIQNGKVEIQWVDASLITPGWVGQTEDGAANQSIILGLRGNRVYIFRVRFIGASGRVRGPWSIHVSHSIAAAPSIGGQNLLVNPSFELDTANLADNWELFTDGTVGTPTNSDATGIFGSRSQRLDLTNLGTSSADHGGYRQGVNVSGFVNKQMTLSVYAEGTANAKIRLYIDWYASPGGAYVSTSQGVHTLSTSVERFSDTFLVPTGSTFARIYIWIEQRPSAPGAAYLRIDAAQFEPGASATAFTATADEALAVASAAEATAISAAAQATAALTQLSNIASDSILSSVEKPAVVLDYAILTGEQAGIDAQAASFGLPGSPTVGVRKSYADAIAALTAYLATLTGWNVIPGSDVIIVGTTWRGNWSAAYLARQNLLNTISLAASQQILAPGQLTGVSLGGGNLLFNAGLETSGGGTSGFLVDTPGWVRANDPSTPTRVAGRLGGTAVRLTYASAGTYSFGIDTTPYLGMPVGIRGGWRPNTKYVVSTWARCSHPLGFGFGLPGGSVSSAHVIEPVLSPTEWRRYAFRVTWGSSPTTGFFIFAITAAAAGWVEFDDVQVEEGDVLTGWAPGTIGVSQLEPGSTTDVQSLEITDGSYASPNQTWPQFSGEDHVIGTLTYTNTTDRTVNVEMTGAFAAWISVVLAFVYDARILWSVSGGGSGGVGRQMFSNGSGVLDAPTFSGSASVASGQTLTMTMSIRFTRLLGGSVSGSTTVNWSGASMRRTAVLS